MKIWILSYNDSGDTKGPLTHMFSPEDGIVFADRDGAETGLANLVDRLFSGNNWYPTEDNETKSAVTGPVADDSTRLGWAMIEAHELQPIIVVEDLGRLPATFQPSDQMKITFTDAGPFDIFPAPWGTPEPVEPDDGDTVVLHKPGAEDSVGWRVTHVVTEGQEVLIERGGSSKHLVRTHYGRWVYPRDVWATFEKPREAAASDGRETYRFKKAPDGHGQTVTRVSDGRELGTVTSEYSYGQNFFSFDGAPRDHYALRKDAAAMMDALSRAREDAGGYKPGDQVAWAHNTGSLSSVRLDTITSIDGDSIFLYGRSDPITLRHLAYAKYGDRSRTLPKYEG